MSISRWSSNREIDFAFVSCSCRACERAGEAKLRERVRDVPSQRWGVGWEDVLLLRRGFRLGLPSGWYMLGF